MTVKVIDTNSHITAAVVAALKAEGVTGVLRYLGTWPSGKGITKAEYGLILASGLDLALIYESTETQMNGDGAADARKALAEMAKLGVPAGTPVIFCNDTDTVSPTQVVKYLTAAAGVMGGKHLVILYGGYAACKAAADAGFRVWQSYGNSGNGKNLWPNKEARAVLWQHTEWNPPNAKAKVWGDLGGIDYDPNEVGGNYGAIGRVAAPVATKADKAKAFLLAQLHDAYVMGAESPGKALDCSGTFHQMNLAVGFDVPDDTAAGYYDRMTPRKGEPQPGDAGFLKDSSGHVHHMACAIGDGTEVEARSAHMTPNVQHRPISEFEAESGFAGWRYWPGHDFGKLGGATPPAPVKLIDDLGPGAVYEMSNGKDYLTTVSLPEARASQTLTPPYTFVGKPLSVHPGNTLMLRRFVRNGIHLLTADHTEMSALLATKPAWKDGGQAFLVSAVGTGAGTRVNRWRNPATGAYRYRVASQPLATPWVMEGAAFNLI